MQPLKNTQLVDTNRTYRELLFIALPQIIDCDQEHERQLKLVDQLMEIGEENLSSAQNELLGLLVGLIADYEDRTVDFPRSKEQ
jgi:hypothetical protein